MKEEKLIIRFSIKNIHTLIIALVPILGLYRFLGFDIGLGVILVSITGAITIFRLMTSGKAELSFGLIVITYLYYIIRKSGYYSDQLFLIMAMINIVGFCFNSIDSVKLRKYIEAVAMINSFLVILQAFSHYVLGFNLILVNETLLNEGVQLASINGTLYRPSALFLEPAHFAEYCAIALISVLFPNDNGRAKLKKAVFITIGCLLTTSGIGIAIVLGIFGWYVLFTRRKHRTKIIYLVLWAFIIAIVAVFLFQIPFFRLAIQRVFGEVDGYNAFRGRFWAWDIVIGQMKGSTLLWGYGSPDFFKGYMTGIMQIIVQYGVAGLILFSFLFLYVSLKGRTNYIVIGSVVYCGMMIVANLTSAYSMIFYTSVVYSQAAMIIKSKRETDYTNDSSLVSIS